MSVLWPEDHYRVENYDGGEEEKVKNKMLCFFAPYAPVHTFNIVHKSEQRK